MADQLSLSLQAWPVVDKDKESLQFFISQIIEQKGAFRHISEKKLEDEIRDIESGKERDGQQDVEYIIEDADVVKSKKEKVYEAREEIFKQISQAQMETVQALDFVSLLLSKNNPGLAALTMSPFLKQTLPIGSLNAEVVQAPQKLDVEKHNEQMVSLGWRMQSLSGAADSLLKSATRLEEEMERETTYWNQVMAVKEQGWSLCRLPREKTTLGVRYGFAEAVSDFRDRGLAALRRDEDGNLDLDRGLRYSGDRNIRVRILQNGKPISSSIRRIYRDFEDDSIEREILQARNSIFDEELHHELHREARNLVNQGVRCVDTRVLLPYEKDKQIEIDLISMDQEDVEVCLDSDITSGTIAICLPILLSDAHRQNLHERSQLPQPLREGQRPRPIYAILKPITEMLQHRSHVESLRNILDAIKRTMVAAGLEFSLGELTSSVDYAAISRTVRKTDVSAIESMLQILKLPLTTSMTLQLPSGLTMITVDIRTSFLPPIFGTTYRFTVTTSTSIQSIITMPKSLDFSMVSALEDHIVHIIKFELVHHISSISNGWHPTSIQRTTMTRNAPGTAVRETIAIGLSKEQLNLSWQPNSGLGEERMWTWSGERRDTSIDQEENKTLSGVFAEEIDAVQS